MIDARENELQRTALGADHQIDRRRIAPETLVQRRGEQQKQRDRRHPEGEQREVEKRRQRAATDVGEDDASEIHFSFRAEHTCAETLR